LKLFICDCTYMFVLSVCTLYDLLNQQFAESSVSNIIILHIETQVLYSCFIKICTTEVMTAWTLRNVLTCTMPY